MLLNNMTPIDCWLTERVLINFARSVRISIIILFFRIRPFLRIQTFRFFFNIIVVIIYGCWCISYLFLWIHVGFAIEIAKQRQHE